MAFEVFSYLVGSLPVLGHDALKMFADGIFVFHEIGEGTKDGSFGEVLAIYDQSFVKTQVFGDASGLDGIA